MPRPRPRGQPVPPVQQEPAAGANGIAGLIGEAREVKSAMRALYGRSNQLLHALQQHRRRAQVVDATLRSLKKLQGKVS